MKYPRAHIADPIPALLPRDGHGHQFVCYGDSCSGIPGAKHEATFASVNAIAARIWPAPDFYCFLGDHVSGLTGDHAALRAQWKYWLEHEMAWLDRDAIPVFHTTSNHVTYDRTSEDVFREMLPELPRNGPAGQEGLTYYVRRGDLLLVFVNTSYSGLGGDGFVETEWLSATLEAHRDARHKLVLGHQPAHSVNGYAGPHMREIAPENARAFWSILVKHGVTAYICSHMLAFDVQVHQGVLQIVTAGAGTAHLLPGEYLHLVQLAIDDRGLRYQVLDTNGKIRECLSWPVELPPGEHWRRLKMGTQDAPIGHSTDDATRANVTALQIECVAAEPTDGCAQTLLSGWNDGSPERPFWIGLRGIDQELTIIVAPIPGRSPQIWRGPSIAPNKSCSIQIAIHSGMGPGGFLYRSNDSASWTSFSSSSSWGAERISKITRWTVGHCLDDPQREPFRGSELEIRANQAADAK